MALEAQHQPPADRHRAAEAALRSGRRQEVQVNDTTLTSGRREPHKPRSRRGAVARTPAEREQILRATSGGWNGLVDSDRLKRELNALQRDESLHHSR